MLNEVGESGMRKLTQSTYLPTKPENVGRICLRARFALMKKQQAKVYSDHRTISLISHTGKIIARVLSRRLVQRIEAVSYTHLDVYKRQFLRCRPTLDQELSIDHSQFAK